MSPATRLIEISKSWKPGDNAGFQEVVWSYLAFSGNQHRRLADEFEAAVSSVSRWASGHARPFPRIQRDVVAWIQKQAETVVP